jgi:hypothetical protein
VPSRVALSDTSCCEACGTDIVIACLQRLEQQNVARVDPSLPWRRALTASLGSLDRLCVCDSMVGSGTAHFRASSTQVWGMLHHCGPLAPKFGILASPGTYSTPR